MSNENNEDSRRVGENEAYGGTGDTGGIAADGGAQGSGAGDALEEGKKYNQFVGRENFARFKQNKSAKGGRFWRWLRRWLIRIAIIALVVLLAYNLFPYFVRWIGSLIPGAKVEIDTDFLSHKMEEAGELIAVRVTDTGVLEAKTGILGATTATFKAAYSFEVGFGVNLKEVSLKAAEDGLTVEVPEAKILYDSFEIVGEPEIWDPTGVQFWNRLLGKGDLYQQLVNEQHAACLAEYTENAEYMQTAWEKTCDQLGDFLRGVVSEEYGDKAGKTLQLTFVHPGEKTESPPAEEAAQ